MSDYEEKYECTFCKRDEFHEILDLGEVPLAGYFPTKNQLEEKNVYPLKLMMCTFCKLVQTDSIINPDVLFKDYRYLSSVGLKNHFKELAIHLDEVFDIDGKNILEIGCNDGVLLEPLAELGANVVGVDPASNVVKVAREKGLNVIEGYFNYENFESHKDKYDLVLANNSFAHISDIKSVGKGVNRILKEDGYFVFEVHYLKNLIDENQWDNIYHEHLYYHSITALDKILRKCGMTLLDFEEIPIHSGSIRVSAINMRLMGHLQPQKVKNRIMIERKTIANENYMYGFTKKVNNHIEVFKNEIRQLSKTYKIAGYGASGRANMFCNLTGLDENVVQFVVDESPERCGRYIANTKIPIVDVDTLKNSDVDIIIIFAWNYSKMIMEKTKFKKCSYLVAFPNVQLVDSYDELEGFDSI